MLYLSNKASLQSYTGQVLIIKADRVNLHVREHKFEPWRGSEGGRVLWWLLLLLLLAAAQICCELQCRTPPRIVAAELIHLGGKTGRGSRRRERGEKPAMRGGENWTRSPARLFSWMN